MKELVDQQLLARGYDPSSFWGTQLVYAAVMLAVALALVSFGAIFAGFTSYWERRVAARIQSRVGPNRVGPFGLLQWVADALKLMFKEDLISSSASATLFRVAPYFVLVAFAMTFVALPFGYRLSATHMNVGIYFVVSSTALTVIGILLSGWASNAKWSLLGGMRAAAQVVSYEIPAGLALLVPVLMAGALDAHGIIRAQGGWPWEWFVFQTPWAFGAFFVMFIALLAEGNRTPFDLPEAESELVSGYNTEYSGMRFSYFFLAEWGNLWVIGALLATLFLGGWQVPFVPMSRVLEWESGNGAPLWFYLASTVVFVAKVLALVNVTIWVRWSLPRVRVDQVMALCWRYLVPAGLCFLLLAAATEVLSHWLFGAAAAEPAALTSVRGALHVTFFIVAGALPALRFLRRTFQHISLAGERVDLSNW